MGTAVKGSDKLIHVDDGAGEMVEIPYQGDATYNPGKSAEISRTKNGAHPYSTDAGHTITFSIEKERPALAAHTRLRTLSASGDLVQVSYDDPKAGGETLTGEAMVVVGEETANTEGVLTQSVTIAFVDDPVPGVTA